MPITLPFLPPYLYFSQMLRIIEDVFQYVRTTLQSSGCVMLCNMSAPPSALAKFSLPKPSKALLVPPLFLFFVDPFSHSSNNGSQSSLKNAIPRSSAICSLRSHLSPLSAAAHCAYLSHRAQHVLHRSPYLHFSTLVSLRFQILLHFPMTTFNRLGSLHQHCSQV